MARIRYIVLQPGGAVTRPLTRAAAHRKARGLGRILGPDWRLRERGGDSTAWRDDYELVVAWLENRLEREHEGDTWILEGQLRPEAVRIRVVELDPPTIQTAGNADIDAIYSYVVRRFPGHIRSAGICVRKMILGSSSWSQHSPWPEPDPGANAWDWFAPSFRELSEQAIEVVRAVERDGLPVGLLLVGDRAWSPIEGWHDSGAAYHPHIHVQGRRARDGSPRSSC